MGYMSQAGEKKVEVKENHAANGDPIYWQSFI